MAKVNKQGDTAKQQTKRTCAALLIATALTMLATAAHAQPGQADSELSIEHVAGNVYMIQRPGGGGNIGALIGEDGVLLVDSLFAPMSESLVR
ncbi:MAG: hypothetical protein WD005_04745, partial [Haliea sp.]